MMADPRLQSVSLLTLAAMRARRRRQMPDWRQSTGLASLLLAARSLPRRDPWSLPSVEDGSGLAGMLAEARQRQKERDHGA